MVNIKVFHSVTHMYNIYVEVEDVELKKYLLELTNKSQEQQRYLINVNEFRKTLQKSYPLAYIDRVHMGAEDDLVFIVKSPQYEIEESLLSELSRHQLTLLTLQIKNR